MGHLSLISLGVPMPSSPLPGVRALSEDEEAAAAVEVQPRCVLPQCDFVCAFCGGEEVRWL